MLMKITDIDMKFHPKDNPLNGVKVEMHELDSEKTVYALLHGTTEGYKKRGKIESIEQQKKHRARLNF